MNFKVILFNKDTEKYLYIDDIVFIRQYSKTIELWHNVKDFDTYKRNKYEIHEVDKSDR